MKKNLMPPEYVQMKKEPYFENDYSWMWIEDGILFQVYKPELVTTLEVAKTLVADRKKLSGGVTRPVYVDMRNIKKVDRQAMRYYKTKEVTEYISGGAFLLDNYFARLLYNTFISMKKPLVPSKFFTDVNEALSWLEKFKFLN